MSDPTAAEQIAEHRDGRLNDLREILLRIDRAQAVNNNEKYEAADEQLVEYPLAVSVSKVWRIDLGTGGPGDWFEVHTDEDNDVTRIEYHFAPWFDHASIELFGDDHATAETFARRVTADFYTSQ